MRQQGTDRDHLRRDHDVDIAAFHQLGVRRPIDERHDAAGAQALGQHRGHDVGFIRIGQRREHIGAVDVFLNHQFFVGRVALQDDGALQDFGGATRAARIALDQLDLVRVLERAREPQSDVAATGDDELAHLRQALAHFGEHLGEIVARRDEENLIALGDHRVAAGAQQSPVAIDRGDAHV